MDRRPLVVVITYTGLGDLLMTVPLARALRPRFRVLPVTSPSQAEMAGLLCRNGMLEDSLPIERTLRFRRDPLGHLQVCRAISRRRPDILLIYGKVLFAYAARFGLVRARRTLFCHPRGRGPSPAGGFEVLPPTGNQGRDCLQFAERLGVPAAPCTIEFTGEVKDRHEREARALVPWSAYVVVAPWTTDPRREAPLEFFRDGIRTIVEEGRLPVVVAGLPRHRGRAPDLVRGFSEEWVKNLVGRTTLRQMLGCLAGARFMLSNDGGAFHLSRLVGTPALVVFGPTAPEQRTFDFSPALIPIRAGLSCSPCLDTPHRYRCPYGPLQCLQGLDGSTGRHAILEACGAAFHPAR